MTMGSAEVGVIVQAINKMADGLMARVEKTESDFIGHLKKVESSLSQLVELTKEVAVIRVESTHLQEKVLDLLLATQKQDAEHKDTIKRMHERIDSTDKEHQKLKGQFHKAFWIGSGMWIVTAFWFNITAPVKKVEQLIENVNSIKEDVKDINSWRFEQIQNQRFRK